jgi:gamma-glutamyltranspeptidase/glutathione hydrolase
MGHNSKTYINLLAGVIDLGMADREKYFGDPDAVAVSGNLWSKRYATARRSIISSDKGFNEMPPYGDPETNEAVGGSLGEMVARYKDHPDSGQTDTTYVAVADASGNLFSLTPSDGGYGSPMVPGYGIILGQRMTQFRLTSEHPGALAPGKRPTITPAPALVMKNGKPYMAFGTPGADMQTQSMLQVFLNLTEFGMNVQEAVEAPRFGSYNFPAWFSPHAYHPGRIRLEDRIDAVVQDGLRRLGREIVPWEEWTSLAGAVCAVVFDEKTGTIHAGADPRRESYAVGW